MKKSESNCVHKILKNVIQSQAETKLNVNIDLKGIDMLALWPNYAHATLTCLLYARASLRD